MEVYADADAVRLTLNGKEIGTGKVKKYKALFRTAYAPGTLTAEALDKEGRVVASHCLVSGGRETVLTLKPEKTVLRANNQDLCYLIIEFTDKDGCLKPYVEQPVELSVEGPVSLAGFGSALCKTDEVFGSARHHAYRGRTLAVLRAGKETGKAKITVTSAGMEPSILEVEMR